MGKDKRIGDAELACHQQQGGQPHPHLTEILAKQLTLPLAIFTDSGDEIFPDGDPPLPLPQACHFYSLCNFHGGFLEPVAEVHEQAGSLGSGWTIITRAR